MTFDGRQSLVEDNHLWQTTFDGRHPLMENIDGRKPLVEDIPKLFLDPKFLLTQNIFRI